MAKASSNAIKAGQAYVEITTDDTKLMIGLKRASNALTAFGKASSVVSSIFTGVGDAVASFGKKMAAVGTVASGAFIAAAKTFASYGSSLKDMADRTGVSVEALGELGYAAKQSGSDMDAVELGIKRMQKVIVDAATGSKEMSEALSLIGLSVEQLARLSPEDQFTEIAKAINSISDPTRRAASALTIFGRGSGTRLLPMIKEIGNLRQEFRDLGLVISTDAANRADMLGDAFDRVHAVLKRVAFGIGDAFGTELTRALDKISETVSKTIKWVDANKQTVSSVAKVALAVAAAGGGLIAIGTALGFVGKAFLGLQAIMFGTSAALRAIPVALALIANPLTLIIASVATLGAAIALHTGAASKALEWLKTKFNELAKVAVASWKAIGNALANGDIGAAAEVLWATLNLAWVKGTAAIKSVWQSTTSWLTSTATDAWYGLLNAWNEVSGGIASMWIKSVGLMGETWVGFLNQFENTNASIGSSLTRMWLRAWGAISGEDVSGALAKETQDTQNIVRDNDARATARLKDQAEFQRQTEAQLAADQKRRQNANAAAYAAATAKQKEGDDAATRAADERLKSAQDRWKKAIEAANKAGEAGYVAGSNSKVQNGAKAANDGLKSAIEAVGSFSVLGGRGMANLQLGYGTGRLEDLMQQTADNTGEIAEAVKGGGIYG